MKPMPENPIRFAYVDERDRKMLSLRLPPRLLDAIKQIAKKKGWEVTEVVQHALDQLAITELGEPKKGKAK